MSQSIMNSSSIQVVSRLQFTRRRRRQRVVSSHSIDHNDFRLLSCSLILRSLLGDIVDISTMFHDIFISQISGNFPTYNPSHVIMQP